MITSVRKFAQAFDRLTLVTLNAPRWDASSRRYVQI